MSSVAEWELSVVRSRARLRVLLMLSSLSEAFPAQLARATQIEPRRLRWLMHGHPPAYRAELALVPLGLAEERTTPNGRVYAITARGRKKARQLSARTRRRRARPA